MLPASKHHRLWPSFVDKRTHTDTQDSRTHGQKGYTDKGDIRTHGHTDSGPSSRKSRNPPAAAIMLRLTLPPLASRFHPLHMLVEWVPRCPLASGLPIIRKRLSHAARRCTHLIWGLTRQLFRLYNQLIDLPTWLGNPGIHFSFLNICHLVGSIFLKLFAYLLSLLMLY